jgi:hypothetical protein
MDCAELNGDCPSQVTRHMFLDFHKSRELNSCWPVCFGIYKSGNVPTNPCGYLSPVVDVMVFT